MLNYFFHFDLLFFYIPLFKRKTKAKKLFFYCKSSSALFSFAHFDDSVSFLIEFSKSISFYFTNKKMEDEDSNK